MIPPLFVLHAADGPPLTDPSATQRAPLIGRFDDVDAGGGETIVDLALCLILAVAIVALLTSALP